MKSLLVVDDEPSVRSIISRWGESHGYAVSEAASADAALERMHQSPADIALCDLNMPGHDGRWLADQLRTHFPGTALLMTTGIDAQQAAAELPPEALACLTKPFTFGELASMLERAVDWQIEEATARLWHPA